jgi:hypothetical protein
MHLKDFFLGTPMANFEYMKIHIRDIPKAIMDLYHLWDLFDDKGFVDSKSTVECTVSHKPAALPPQAGRIAYDYLKDLLAPHGYTPCELTPGLWKQNAAHLVLPCSRPFWRKVRQQSRRRHLLAALGERYEYKTDWDGTRYCGLTIRWDYERRECLLMRFRHKIPSLREDALHAWQKLHYCQKIQWTPDIDTSPLLDPAGKKRLQELGHPQPATVIVTDNSIASGIANDTIKQRRSKAIDMGYYWIRDRVRQKHIDVLWRKGELNWADYPSKHHLGMHHRNQRPSYLHVPNDANRNYSECLQDGDDPPDDDSAKKWVNLQTNQLFQGPASQR